MSNSSPHHLGQDVTQNVNENVLQPDTMGIINGEAIECAQRLLLDEKKKVCVHINISK